MRIFALIPAGLLIASSAMAQVAPVPPPAPPTAQSAAPAAASSQAEPAAAAAQTAAPAEAKPAAAAAAPAEAQSAAAPAAPAEAQSAAAPAAPAPAAPQPAKAGHKGGGFKAKFEAANTTNDGKLTKDQAQAGHLNGVFKNFDAIDADHKGYVTLEDIKAFRASHAHKKPSANSVPAAPSAN